MQCTNSQKQFVLAWHNHHDVHNAFPSGTVNFGKGIGTNSNSRWWNQHTSTLPFIEQTALYDDISGSKELPFSSGDNTVHYYRTKISAWQCPSDGNVLKPGLNDSGRTSICVSWGDFRSRDCSDDSYARGFIWESFAGTSSGDNVLPDDRVTKRSRWRTMSDITDGTSNTILSSELITAEVQGSSKVKGGIVYRATIQDTSGGDKVVPSDCMNNACSTGDRSMLQGTISNVWRGGRQFQRAMIYTYFNTIMPPNSPMCSRDNASDNQWGFYPPQSNHQGGVNGGFSDGSVRFISDTIDCNGLPTAVVRRGGESDYGVWGAIGSVNGGESKGL